MPQETRLVLARLTRKQQSAAEVLGERSGRRILKHLVPEPAAQLDADGRKGSAHRRNPFLRGR
jgi:hypothetical protein